MNATFFNLLFIPLSHLKACEAGEWKCDKEQLKIGRGTANIKLTFSTPVYWFTLMGTFCERPSEVYLCVDAPHDLVNSLNSGHLIGGNSSAEPTDDNIDKQACA